MFVSDLLKDKFYESRRRRLSGRIIYAEKRDDVYIKNDDVVAYAVQVRPENSRQDDFWATIYVANK